MLDETIKVVVEISPVVVILSVVIISLVLGVDVPFDIVDVACSVVDIVGGRVVGLRDSKSCETIRHYGIIIESLDSISRDNPCRYTYIIMI